MTEWISALLIIGGASFMLLAAIGIIRMPDVYLRLQTTTKAVTLGTGGVLTAFAIHFGTISVVTRVLLVIAFLGLTVPVWAHMIGRAAYIVGVPLWEGTGTDELKASSEEHVSAAENESELEEGNRPGTSQGSEATSPN